MNILDGDAVWEIDIERTTQLKKKATHIGIDTFFT